MYGFTPFTLLHRIGRAPMAGWCVDISDANALEIEIMTYAAPTFDAYDDGLVHSHDWARNTPPGSKHSDRQSARHERDESVPQDSRRDH